ncbi:hypothetical protein PG996_010776 [Apiospora saccharicola]|uniref:Fungal STAND N-terminal Goodbye domain-containing protein n=1 Tax=Apiospora saccharicola TaxID=335842 RepID=A0ABR1URZ5_9PEZI
MSAHETQLQESERRPSIWKDWLRFEVPEGDPDVEVLQAEAKAASEIWRKLKLDIGDLGGSGDQVPSVQTLLAAVQGAQAQWTKKSEKGFGKAKAQFFSFLETMDSHKYLFSVIPNGDKYTSLITGIITTVVKVGIPTLQCAKDLFAADT